MDGMNMRTTTNVFHDLELPRLSQLVLEVRHSGKESLRCRREHCHSNLQSEKCNNGWVQGRR